MDEIVKVCLEKRQQDIDYSIIRKELLADGYEMEEIKIIFNQVNELYFSPKKISATNYKVKAYIKIGLGLSLFTFGLIMNSRGFNNNTGFKIIWVAPVFSGIALYFAGRRELRRKGQNTESIFRSGRK